MNTGSTRNEAFRTTLNELRPKFVQAINEAELTEEQRKFGLWLIE